jgi:AbrB family looped-hinge helix DNA binding protein
VAFVKVKEKYQVTLPADIRKKADLNVGDVLEAKVQGKKITLAPKVIVDREFIERRLAEAEEDIKKGRVSRRYSSAKAFVRALHHEAKKLKQTP